MRSRLAPPTASWHHKLIPGNVNSCGGTLQIVTISYTNGNPQFNSLVTSGFLAFQGNAEDRSHKLTAIFLRVEKL